jgi:2-methylcitrate dehydratase PrpD
MAKVMHPGWAAHGAIVAVRLAAAGFTGPARVIEGKAGLLASHLQDIDDLDFTRATQGLGEKWESLDISFKPFPNAHVIHGLIEAALSATHEITDLEKVEQVICSVAPHWIDIVCEPVAAKRRPANTAAARISMQHTIAEGMMTGRLDATSYTPERLSDRSINALADKVIYSIRDDWTDRSRFPGEICIVLHGGREVRCEIPTNLGSSTRPLGYPKLLEKFRRNVGLVLPNDRVLALEAMFDPAAGGVHPSKLTAMCAVQSDGLVKGSADFEMELNCGPGA